MLWSSAILTLSRRLRACPYSGCLQGYPELMRLRHLLWRSVPCECPPSTVKITVPDKTTHVHAMLHIAAKFPRMTADGSPASLLHAQSWLLQECNVDLLKQLSEKLNINPPANDADGVIKCVLLHSQAFFIC
jgi:hypothetical protein